MDRQVHDFNRAQSVDSKKTENRLPAFTSFVRWQRLNEINDLLVLQRQTNLWLLVFGANNVLHRHWWRPTLGIEMLLLDCPTQETSQVLKPDFFAASWLRKHVSHCFQQLVSRSSSSRLYQPIPCVLELGVGTDLSKLGKRLQPLVKQRNQLVGVNLLGWKRCLLLLALVGF